MDARRVNSVGEWTKIGIYLALSRQADREGFPEVAAAYKRIAFEEADHGAAFAGLLSRSLQEERGKVVSLLDESRSFLYTAVI